MKKMITLGTLAALFLALAPAAQAAITFVNTGSAHTGSEHKDLPSFPGDFTLTAEGTSTARSDGIYSYSYDAGASFDMLVVSVSRESSSGPTFSVSYDGVSMDLATGTETGTGASIYYLATSAQNGTIALDFTNYDVDDKVINSIGIGIAAIKSEDPDFPSGLIDADYGTGTSITIDPTVDGSFTMFALDTNNFAFSALTSPLTQIDKNEDIGSSGFAAGYDQDVAAGEITYSYVNTVEPRGIAAANFAPVASGGTVILFK